jgi:hypothetical protein
MCRPSDRIFQNACPSRADASCRSWPMTDDTIGVVEILTTFLVPCGMHRSRPARTIFIAALLSSIVRPSEMVVHVDGGS